MVRHLEKFWAVYVVVMVVLVISLTAITLANATDQGQWANAPNAEWYKKQVPTPGTLKAYEIGWSSCCDKGDVCQECVIHRYSNHPPWADGWYYERNGELKPLPPHIVEYVPWTPTGKPVLFIAPFGAGNMKKDDPVCLKVPGGAV